VYIETTVVSDLTALPSRDILRLSHGLVAREWWTNQPPLFEL
jgi:hypothetical protein